MNKFEKQINKTARIMTDVTCTKLYDEEGICWGYDYSENEMFRFYRKELRNRLKMGDLTIDRIGRMRSGLYSTLTYIMCNENIKEFLKYYNRC